MGVGFGVVGFLETDVDGVRIKRKLFYAEIECTRRRSARSSEEIHWRPEIYLRLNLKLDARELLSLQSLVDSVLKSIESCTDFGTLIRLIDLKVRCKKKAMVLFVKMNISCALPHEAGRFLLGYLLGVLPKGLQGTKHRSPEAGEVRCSKSRVYGFEPQCMDCACMPVTIPRMLKKDTSQLGDRILNNFSCVILGGPVAEHKVSTRLGFWVHFSPYV
ncbi:hypothetical protein Q3G72_023812 [Acer saccharum]|nr:hypothetical protein Q3G72_023812 [Acer saccharum]